MPEIKSEIENDKFGKIELLDITSSAAVKLKGFNIEIELRPGFDKNFLKDVVEVLC